MKWKAGICAIIIGFGLLSLVNQSARAQALSPFNGTYTWLPSAARTTTQTLPDQVGVFASGLEVLCNISAASGTGGLQVSIQGKDPVSGTYYTMGQTTANTSVSFVRALLFPVFQSQAATATKIFINDFLPYIWRIQVIANDTSSYTYSCDYTLYRLN